MRRLSIFMLAAAALVAVTSARADWHPMWVQGVPQDVEIRDGGHFALAVSMATPQTLDGGFEILLDASGNPTFGQALSSVDNPLVSAFVDDGSDGGVCLTVTSGQGTVLHCDGTSAWLLPTDAGFDTSSSVRVRHLPGGGGYAEVFDVSNPNSQYAALYGTGRSALPWQQIPGLSTTLNVKMLPAVSARSIGGVDYGLFAMSRAYSTQDLRLVADGGVVAQSDSLLTKINEVQLFEAGGQVKALAGGKIGDAGLSLATFADGGASVVPISEFNTSQVTGIAFDLGTGDRYGDGFGMVIVAPDAGMPDGGLFGAVPDPGQPATRWVQLSPPSLAGPLVRVRCWEGQTCVLLTSVDGNTNAQPNVLIYNNAAPPAVTLPASPIATIAEGQTSPAVSASASDPDGDPLYLTWEVEDAGSSLLTVNVEPGSDGGSATFSAAPGTTALCGQSSQDFPVRVYASDGLASHLRWADGGVRVTHAPPGMPQVNPPSSIPAGAPPVFVPVTAPTGTCPIVGFTWTQGPDAGLTLVPDAGGATLIPVLNYCNPDGGAFTFGVSAVEGSVPAGSTYASAPATFTVLLKPWGPPGPALDGGTVVQVAGTTATYAATGAHPCVGTPGFPGVDTSWSFSSTVPGVLFEEGGQPVGAGVVAPSIDVVAPACTSGTVSLGAVAVTHGDNAALMGPDAGLTVQIQTVLQPIADAGISLAGGYDPASAELRGTIAAAVDCAPQRGLGAELTLLLPDGGAAGATTVSLPGTGPQPWQLPAPAGCAGGTFVVNAQLEDDGGTGASAQLQVTTPQLPAGVGGIDAGPAVATCQGGVATATFTLTATPGPGQCPTSSMSWTQLGGPQATLLPQGNNQVQVEASGAGFGDLVGQSLSIRATASAGNGTVGSADVTVPISAMDLVDVQHLTDAPVASESGILGVAVRLTNRTGCGISSAEYRESLDGLRYVPGSARLDGQPATPVLQGDQLILSGLELPPQQTRQVTFSARPRLLTSSRPSGQAFLNGVPISAAEQGLRPQPPVGCGCSGGGAGFSAMALALTSLLLRHRARRSRRKYM